MAEETLEEQVDDLLEGLESDVQALIGDFKTKLSELLEDAGAFDEDEEEVKP